MPIVVQPQGLGQIAGGTNAVWNDATAAARTDAMLADIAAMREATPGAGFGMMPPAVPASGAHYSAPGAYEGYADYGFPPVMYQRSPYATAAYRTYMNPFGQLGVQPLIGFPSAYPHVIQYPGDNPFREMPNLMSLAQAIWSAIPMPPMMPMRGGMGVGGGAPRGGRGAAAQPTGNPTAEAQDQTQATQAFVGPPRPIPYMGQDRVNANYESLGIDYPWNYYTQTGVTPPRVISGIPAGTPESAAASSWVDPINTMFDNARQQAAGYEAALEEQAVQQAAPLALEYNAALQQQSPAVMRAAQQAIPLPQLAAPSGMKVPQTAQLPPIAPLAPPSRNPALIDAVNQAIR